MAHDLKRTLDGRPDRHVVLTLFASDPVVLFPDESLGVPMGRLRSLGYDPRVLARLRRRLRELRPDLVVAHGGEPLKYLAVARPRGVPLVYLALGIVTPAARRGMRRIVYRALMRRAAVVVGVSRETTDEAHEVFGTPPKRLALLPNGRDPARYRLTPRTVRKGPVELVFVGHLTATKRPDLFVALMAELARRGRDVHGTIVGDGPLEEDVRRSAVRSNLAVLGRRTDVPRLLGAADIFVFTSLREGEGMPGVIIEAGLTGLPTVATDVPGVTTVLEDSVTGFVVPVADFASLVDACERLVLDRNLRTRMGAEARRRCERDFSLTTLGRRWTELIDAVAEPGASGPVRSGRGSPA